jgi:putative hydrolase of the HAD superfamily
VFTEKIKAIIFDLDGTLFDRDNAQIRIVDLFVQRFPDIFQGISTDQIVTAFIESEQLIDMDWKAGKPAMEIRSKRSGLFLGLLGIKENISEAITEIYIQSYPRMNIPVVGAVSLINELSNKFKFGVISNGFSDAQYKKIEAIGIDNLLLCVLISDEIGIRKPDQGIFLRAAQLLGCYPDECLFVGDSFSADVVGAKAAGMLACWYNPELLPEEDELRADIVVHKLADLALILRR